MVVVAADTAEEWAPSDDERFQRFGCKAHGPKLRFIDPLEIVDGVGGTCRERAPRWTPLV